MSYEPDLIVTDQNNQTIAIIEVKDRPKTNKYLAAEMYRQFLKYKVSGSPRYFLLFTRESVSFWQVDLPIRDDLAVLEFVTHPVFKFYEKQTDTFAKGSLDFLVFIWLADLTNGGGPDLSSYVSSKEFESFKTDIRGAQVRFGAR